MAESIIELKNITKCYQKDIPVIKNLSLKVEKGEFITLLGPSGCGKTTTLRMIGGFDMPTGGQIFMHGKDITGLLPNQRPVNTVFQKYALFPHLNTRDNIAFGLKLKKLPKKEIDERVEKVLSVVDLEGFEKRSIHSLSGGQQQRVAIARAIINEPEILLLDEPLGALDLKMRQEMQLELKNMHQQLGITFIYVTHDQQEALTMSDRIVVMAGGEIQQEGTPEEIYNEPRNAFVADFIGESNIFNGVMTGKLKASFCGEEFDCVDDYPVKTAFDAVVRPEDIVITAPDSGKLKGEVISCIFMGSLYEITIQCGKNEVVAHGLKNIKPGTRVGMEIDRDNIHIMPRNLKVNHYEGTLDEKMVFHFADGCFHPDFSRIYPGSYQKDGILYGKGGQEIPVHGVKMVASYLARDAKLSDNPQEGAVKGNISSIIYKGDHYSYIVRSANHHDYYVNDEYLWNNGDFVSVIIPEDKIQYKIVE